MKIRERTYASGETAFQLDVGMVDGKRMQLAFPTRKAADAHQAKLLEEKRAHGVAALKMTHEQRLRYAAAEVKLAEAGVSVEQAVEWALERTKAVRRKVLVPELVELFMADRRAKNKRDRYVRQLGVSLGSFAERFAETPASAVTREMVKVWLSSNGWAPKTQENYLGDLRACCNWARIEGMMSHKPCEGIETPTVDEVEVQIFSPEQCESLLVTALNYRGPVWDRRVQRYFDGFPFRKLLGYATVATFVGVRPEEVVRSSRAKIHLNLKTMVVQGRAAKTRQRRTVELPANAVLWLELWMKLCPDEEMIVPKNFRRLWEACREAAKLSPPGWHSRRVKSRATDEVIDPWPKDVLRHTAATMHYALYQNLALLQAQLGHHEDEDTLFKNYRAVEMPTGGPVTKEIAERFYAIVPPAVDAVGGVE